MSTAMTVTTIAVHSAKTPTPTPTAIELSDALPSPEKNSSIFSHITVVYLKSAPLFFNNSIINRSISIISGTHFLRKADYERLKFTRLSRLIYKLL